MATAEQREIIKRAYYGGAYSGQAFGSKVITKDIGDIVGELPDAEAFPLATAWLQSRIDKRTATRQALLLQIDRIDAENAKDAADMQTIEI